MSEDEPRVTSRLFRGYGPLLGFILTMVIIANYLPTGRQTVRTEVQTAQPSDVEVAGVKHIIVTHPTQDIVCMSLDEVKEIVSLGPEIYAEFTSQFGNPGGKPETVKEYVDAIRAAGVEHSFVSSDTGQVGTFYQPDALANAAKTLRANGFSEHELDVLFKINPAKILGLTPPEGTR